MKYILMCQGQIKEEGGYRSTFTAEYSGIKHKTKIEAREEMRRVSRYERENQNITHIWITEVEDE